jgi:hypothetical protein
MAIDSRNVDPTLVLKCDVSIITDDASVCSSIDEGSPSADSSSVDFVPSPVSTIIISRAYLRLRRHHLCGGTRCPEGIFSNSLWNSRSVRVS